MVEPAEVDGCPAPRPGFLNGAVVLLQATDAHTAAGRQQGELGALLERAANQGAGHDRTESRHGKRAIDGQPRSTNVGTRGRFRELRVERRPKLVEARASAAGHRDDRRLAQ